MTKLRKVIVHIATSADGYIARPDGDLDWLTSRPAPSGFYGLNAFMRSIDTKVLGRKTYEASLRLGAKFGSEDRTIVFSRHAPPAGAPPGVEFVSEAIGPFVNRLRAQPGTPPALAGGESRLHIRIALGRSALAEGNFQSAVEELVAWAK